MRFEECRGCSSPFCRQSLLTLHARCNMYVATSHGTLHDVIVCYVTERAVAFAPECVGQTVTNLMAELARPSKAAPLFFYHKQCLAFALLA